MKKDAFLNNLGSLFLNICLVFILVLIIFKLPNKWDGIVVYNVYYYGFNILIKSMAVMLFLNIKIFAFNRKKNNEKNARIFIILALDVLLLFIILNNICCIKMNSESFIIKNGIIFGGVKAIYLEEFEEVKLFVENDDIYWGKKANGNGYIYSRQIKMGKIQNINKLKSICPNQEMRCIFEGLKLSP